MIACKSDSPFLVFYISVINCDRFTYQRNKQQLTKYRGLHQLSLFKKWLVFILFVLSFKRVYFFVAAIIYLFPPHLCSAEELIWFHVCMCIYSTLSKHCKFSSALAVRRLAAKLRIRNTTRSANTHYYFSTCSKPAKTDSQPASQHADPVEIFDKFSTFFFLLLYLFFSLKTRELLELRPSGFLAC